MTQGMLLKLGEWLVTHPPPTRALKVLLLLLSLKDKEDKATFQRPTLKRLLKIKNDGILTKAIGTLEGAGLIKLESKRISSKRKVTYTYKVMCPAPPPFFLLPQKNVSQVGPGRHKQPGLALQLTGNGLRLLLFLHLTFSGQQAHDESLKLGRDGCGTVEFDSLKAKEMLDFRNFHRYLAELKKKGLIVPDGYSDSRKPRFLLSTPYFKKRTQPLPTDPPQAVVSELCVRMLLRRAEELELISEKAERRQIEELIAEYGADWVEDALYTVHCRIQDGKAVGPVIDTAKGILRHWVENGKVIGFRDPHIDDCNDRETEERAKVFFGRRPRMLQHLELMGKVQFMDRIPRGDIYANFPLLVEDFPGGQSYYSAREELKHRFLVLPEFDGAFNVSCDRFGLKWVADAYAIVRERWSGTEGLQTEEQKFSWIRDKLEAWRASGKWVVYGADGEYGYFSSSPETPAQCEQQYGRKGYAFKEPFVGARA